MNNSFNFVYLLQSIGRILRLGGDCRQRFFLFLFCSILLLFSTSFFTPDNSQKNQIKFAQISDIHFSDEENKGSRMLGHSQELLKDTIQQVNAMKDVDFVVFTGDMINKSEKDMLKKFSSISNKLKVSWFWTTGNHDIGGELNKEEFVKLLNEQNRYKQNNTYHSLRMGNFVFIFMDGTIEKLHTANALFSDEELLWLDKELTACKDYNAMIFQHYPVVEPFHSLSHKILNSEQYLDVLDRHENVVAVISGHYHAAKIKMRNNVAHISSPSLVQYPNSFRVITFKDFGDKISINFEFIPTKLTSVRDESYSKKGAHVLHYGEKEDREATIEIKKVANPYRLSP